MSDMSFKQAKELVEKIELTELTLNKTVEEIEKSSKKFTKALKHQEYILSIAPKADKKINMLKMLVAVNVGFIAGLIAGKFIL